MSYFLSDSWKILQYFETITRWQFHNRLYGRREVFRYFFIMYFVEIPTKPYTSLVSTYLYPGMIKLQRKSHNLSRKSLFWTSKQSFAIRSFTAMFALWRSQNSLRKRKDHITGNSFIPTRSLTTIINSQIFRYVSKLNQTLIFRNKQYMLCKQRKF